MKKIEVLILIALPASGKSEVRYFLDAMPKTMFPQFHANVASHDDFPYVDFMRHVDKAAIERLKMDPMFFTAPDRGFKNPFEWVTLIELINQDFFYHRTGRLPSTQGLAARNLFCRINLAQRMAGVKPAFMRLPEDVQAELAKQVESEAAKVEKTFAKECPHVTGNTDRSLIIEFSRGAAIGSLKPLDPPYGYEFSMSRLHPEILEKAAVLYIKVTPEQSRIKNTKRAVPPPGCTDTTLFHGVPMAVMLNDYGCDDLEWLLQNSGCGENKIAINAHGKVYYLPAAIMDNTKDLTTFIREERDPNNWREEDINALRDELGNALDKLVK